MPSSKDSVKPAPRKQPRRMLTPDDWIDAATNLLVEKSVDAVRVETLAKQLQITIGSFYYHFKDRNELLAGVLRRWHERTTAQVLGSYSDLTPERALREILSLPFHGETARRAAMIEFAIRGWARHDDMAQQAVKGVDEQRLAYFAAGFQKAGFPKSEASNRAFFVYSFILAQGLLWDANDDKARKKQLNFAKALLMSPLNPTPLE